MTSADLLSLPVRLRIVQAFLGIGLTMSQSGWSLLDVLRRTCIGMWPVSSTPACAPRSSPSDASGGP